MRARSWRAQTTGGDHRGAEFSALLPEAVRALAPMTLAFAYLIVMLFFVFL